MKSKSVDLSDVWKNCQTMDAWLHSAFDKIVNSHDENLRVIECRPYHLHYSPRYLFSVSFLSILRSGDGENTQVSKENFERVFCDVFLNYFQDKQVENENFVGWAARMMALAIKEHRKFLHSMPDDYIQRRLVYKLKDYPKSDQSKEKDRANNSITLFVSALSTIHIGGLWQQLFKQASVKDDVQLQDALRNIEVFLNRYAEKDSRFRPVSETELDEAIGRATQKERAPKLFSQPKILIK